MKSRELTDCGVNMAQQVNVSFVDDLDGGEADGTVVFGMDGKHYEIDLSEKNAAKLRDLLAPYVGAGRRVGVGSRPPRTSSVPRTNREDTKVIREWAVAQGLTVSARGRTGRSGKWCSSPPLDRCTVVATARSPAAGPSRASACATSRDNSRRRSRSGPGTSTRPARLTEWAVWPGASSGLRSVTG